MTHSSGLAPEQPDHQRFTEFLDAMVSGRAGSFSVTKEEIDSDLFSFARDVHERGVRDPSTSPSPNVLSAIWEELMSNGTSTTLQVTETPLVQPLRGESSRRIRLPRSRGNSSHHAPLLLIAAAIVLFAGVVAAAIDRGGGSISPSSGSGNDGGSVPGSWLIGTATPILTDSTPCEAIDAYEYRDANGILPMGTPVIRQPLPTVTIPAVNLEGPIVEASIQHAVVETWRSFAACAQSGSILSMALLMTTDGQSYIFGRSVDVVHAVAGYTDPESGQRAAPPLLSIRELGDGRVVSLINLGPMQSSTAANYVIFKEEDGIWKIDVLAIDLGVPGGTS
ncbi:MAG: hypothetical protein ACRDHN_03195 [Thermomicrobiales bacterium]